MIYFTSDLHLGHANIIKSCSRPFVSVEEMDECLIANWNNRVTNNDTVYILGDLMFRNKIPPEEYLSRLKGKKHLIRGNHDRDWMKKVDINKYFISNENLSYITDGKHRITLCHYPMMSWPHMNTNGYMIFGHIHNNTNAEYWSLIQKSDLMLNAGVDINGFKPVTFEELVENNVNHKFTTAAYRFAEEEGSILDRLTFLNKLCEDLKMDNRFKGKLEMDIEEAISKYDASLKCERYSHHGFTPTIGNTYTTSDEKTINNERMNVMKIAEALNERATLKASLSQIKNRMLKNAKVQEGDTPAEDAKQLAEKYAEVNNSLTNIICKINKTNQLVKNANGDSLADLITRRESYKHLVKVYSELYDEAIIERDRFSRNEIRFISAVSPAELQKDINEFSKRFRMLDTEIQGINWTTDLVD